MKIQLTQDCRGVGKKGDTVEVKDAVGSRLVCEASAVVLEYDQASPENPGSVVMSEAQLEKIEEANGVERKES